MYRDRYFALFLFGFGITALISIGYAGREYYFLSLAAKYNTAAHAAFGPSGIWGHGLGIIGSILMILNFMYSWRKRYEFQEKLGSLKLWLEFHMFVGLFGATLVVYHSAFKFQGVIATVCFFSMVVVVVTGIIGRYLYVQIPRHINGTEFNLAELDERQKQLTAILHEETGHDPEIHQLCENLCTLPDVSASGKPWSLFLQIVKSDWQRNQDQEKLLAALRSKTGTADFFPRIVRTVREKTNLARKIALWKGAHHLFDTWRVLHKKLTWVLFITLGVHVLVTLLFGFTWIF
jgi:hypothetical protein